MTRLGGRRWRASWRLLVGLGLALLPSLAQASHGQRPPGTEPAAALPGRFANPPFILSLASRLPAEATEPFSMTDPGDRFGVSWQPNGLFLVTSRGIEAMLAEPARAGAERERDGTLAYAQVYPGVALRYRPLPHGMSLELWFADAAWGRRIEAGDSLIVSWRMDIEGPAALMQTGDANPWLAVLDERGGLSFLLTQPRLRPAGGDLDRAPSLDIDYRAGRVEDHVELVVFIGADTLKRMLAGPGSVLDLVALAVEPDPEAAPAAAPAEAPDARP